MSLMEHIRADQPYQEARLLAVRKTSANGSVFHTIAVSAQTIKVCQWLETVFGYLQQFCFMKKYIRKKMKPPPISVGTLMKYILKIRGAVEKKFCLPCLLFSLRKRATDRRTLSPRFRHSLQKMVISMSKCCSASPPSKLIETSPRTSTRATSTTLCSITILHRISLLR